MPITLSQNKPLYEGLKVTREEYLDLKEDGYKYDMIDGVLTMSTSAFFEHNDALSEILTKMRNFLDVKKMGGPL